VVVSPAVAVLAAALLLAWPALYNGYPLVFGDTASYLDTIDPRKAHWARPVFYALFILPLHGRTSLWPVVFVQALIVAHLAYVMLRVVCGSVRPGSYLALAAILAVGSTLPWLASFIMPDVFAGVVVLGLYLLGFAFDRLSPVERVYFFFLTAGAIACHQSHLALAAGLVLIIVLLRMLQTPSASARIRAIALVAGPLVLAAAAHLSANAFAGQGLTLSPGTSMVLLARMIADGTAVQYLRETCPQRRYVLCDYLDDLPEDADAFLWDKRGIFARANGPALRSEAREIVLGVMQAHPLDAATKGAANAAQQLFALEAHDWLPLGEPTGAPIGQYLRAGFPFDYPAYERSRQVTHALPLATLAIWHTFSALFGMALSAFLFIENWRRGDRDMIALFVVILAALVGNALFTGALPVSHGSYQSRVAWLFVFYAALAAYHFYLCSAAESRREA
jgi:hypothetical protein